MRRFFRRRPAITPAAMATALAQPGTDARAEALTAMEALPAAQRTDPALQSALIEAAGQLQDVAQLKRVLPLIVSPDALATALSRRRDAALAYLQLYPERSEWPDAVQALPELTTLSLRQRLTEAASDTAALVVLRSAEVTALPLAEQVELWLTRRDLADHLWALPEATTSDGLGLIERLSRGHNKTINREARERIGQQKEAAAAAAAASSRRDELREAIARLNHQIERAGVRSDRDEAAYALLCERWQAVDGDAATAPIPDLNRTLPQERELIEQAVAAQAEATGKAEARAKAKANTESAADAEANNLPPADADDATKTAAAPVAAAPVAAAPVADAPVAAAGASTEPSTEPQVAPPADSDAPSDLDPQLKEALLAQAAQTQREAAALAEVRAGLTELEAAIEAGSTRVAGTLLSQLRGLTGRSGNGPELPLSKADRRRLGSAQARMREWGSWQTFATSPKRGELLEAMQQAAETPLNPDSQAEKIKELRARWRELGAPRGAAERELAGRFDAAAEAAFEPCRIHFAELAEQRESNARGREALSEMLERYLQDTDWARADFKAAEQILKQARADWRNLHPVPRKREAALSQRFEGLQDQLYERLKQHWSTQRAVKDALVARATALIDDSAPLNDRINEAKRLQSEWQRAGRLPRKDDQALWQLFRGALDQVFGARDAEQQAAEQEQSTLVAEVEAVLAALGDSDEPMTSARLNAGLEQVEQLLSALPERLARGLRGRLAAVERDARDALRAARQAAVGARIEQLLQSDETAASAELSAAAQPAAPLATLRDFVLRCEMRAGIESPASEREARMQLKLLQLQSGLGQADPTADRTALELVEAWCAFGPKHDPQAAALRTRLRAALKVLD